MSHPLRVMLLAICVAGALSSSAIWAVSADSTITPEAAKDHVDKEVTVRMTVKSARILQEKNICFLNSRKDHRDEGNFVAIINGKCLDKFGEIGVENPGEKFFGKMILVRGVVTLYDDKPQIAVESPTQIELVKEE